MGLVQDAKAEQFAQSDELVTATYLNRIGVGKLVAYKGNLIWEMEIGDPFVQPQELLNLFGKSPVPPAKFVPAMQQMMNHMRRMGIDIQNEIIKKTDNFMVTCPDPQCKGTWLNDIANTVIHLNDTHMLSREEIADWLDTLDNQPVFYPSEDLRTTNSARVVACK